MPPASHFAAASWLVPTLDAILFTTPLLLSLLLLWPGAQPGARTATTVLGVLCAVVFVTVLRWYVKPDLAGSPRAGVASMLVLCGPALAMGGFVFWIIRRKGGNAIPAAALSALASYIVGALAFIPALLIFVALGGDTL